MICGILAIFLGAIFQHLNLGCFELIEKCSLPWESYLIEGTKDGIQESKARRKKCNGNAFRTNEGKLICFFKKDIAQRIPNPPSKNRRKKSAIEKCNCGYSLSSYKRNWMSCNVNIPETTKKICDGICEGLTVYLFKRRSKKLIVYCEQDGREEFYEMDGQIGNYHLRYKSTTKYWICTCGIANTHLISDISTRSSDSEIFEECADPWKESKFFDIKRVETCTPRCHRRCQVAYGFYYEQKPFCFHQSFPLIRRTNLHGGSQNICECGHGKRTIHRNKTVEVKLYKEFLSCDPPIVKYDLRPYACKEYCSKLLAYVYRSGSGPWNIRCMLEDDHKSVKPESLSGKCDVDVHTEGNNEECYYMICRCGLRKKQKTETQSISKQAKELEMKLPDVWGVKKKRSKRNHQKTSLKNNCE